MYAESVVTAVERAEVSGDRVAVVCSAGLVELPRFEHAALKADPWPLLPENVPPVRTLAWGALIEALFVSREHWILGHAVHRPSGRFAAEPSQHGRRQDSRHHRAAQTCPLCVLTVDAVQHR